MDPEFLTLMLFGTALAAAVAFGGAWFRSNARVRELEARLLDSPFPDDRRERLEQAVENLGAQIEQLASNQEFFGRVLADKLDRAAGLSFPAASADPPRPVTPH